MEVATPLARVLIGWLPGQERQLRSTIHTTGEHSSTSTSNIITSIFFTETSPSNRCALPFKNCTSLSPRNAAMPTLRQRKRPASPAVEPDPPKKTRQTKKAAPPAPLQVDSNSDIEVVEPPKKAPAKSKGKGKAKPQNDEVDSVVSTTNSKAKAEAEPKYTIPEDATAGSAQYAKAEKLIVPVDETCPFNGHVYIDSNGIIYVSCSSSVMSDNSF